MSAQSPTRLAPPARLPLPGSHTGRGTPMRDRRARWGGGGGGGGNGDSGDFGRDFDTIKDDVAKLKSDLARAMRNLVSTGRGEVSGARGKLEEAIQEKLDRLNSVTENLSEWGQGAA